MMGFKLFDDLAGIPLSAFDVRALRLDEIYKLQAAAQQAKRRPDEELRYIANLAQYQPPKRPLDQRFADFKRRLAAAIEARKSVRNF